MVHPGEKDKEAVREYMGMGPERSKSLHNFSLPNLKWANQRYLRCMKVDSTAGAGRPLRRRSFASRFGESSESIVTGSAGIEQLRQQSELGSQHRQFGPRTSGSSGADGGEEGIDEVREKIMLDLRKVMDRMKKSILRGEVSDDEDGEGETRIEIEKEKQTEKKEKEKDEKGREERLAVVEDSKPWNLRTRRGSLSRAPIGYAETGIVKNGTGYHNEGARNENKRRSYSPLRENAVKPPPPAKAAKDRPKFSEQLTKKEIEEDFMAMVGRRPPRRPKKRPRNVQKQIDTLLPGLWLTEVTPDLYKVPDSGENEKR